MRILLSSNHQYPAYGEQGSGPHPRELPSGSGHHIKDLLAKGLSELGHEVFYLLRKGAATSLPQGVTLLTEPIADVDVYHNFAFRDEDIIAYIEQHRRPWVTTCHLDLRARGKPLPPTTPNWIFVSKTLAHSYNSERFVWNGIDPGDFIYSESKDNYLLFKARWIGPWTRGWKRLWRYPRRQEFRWQLPALQVHTKSFER